MQEYEANSHGIPRRRLCAAEEFALALTDAKTFERAVRTGRLYRLVPGLKEFDTGLPEKDPNIYRPMPLLQHTFESIRQAFALIHGFGAEEYRSPEAKEGAVRWINTALLFHDLGETAIIQGTHLPVWYGLAVEWGRNRERNALILKETYPFFGPETPEARNYIGHLIHPEISAALADYFLSRLGVPAGDIRIAGFLIRNHSILIEKATYGRTKDGRTLHEDFYDDIASVEGETGVPKDDLLKMLHILQLADANAVRPGMAQIPEVTRTRVWLAYDYMMFVLMVRSDPSRYRAFMRHRDAFGRIRREKPFGTPFGELFRELLSRIEKAEGPLEDQEKRVLEQHLEHYEIFRIIKEDHLHANTQFNQLLLLIESASGRELSPEDKALLLTAYKVAYRSHDGDSRRQLKTVPVGDVRRKFIEHPIRVARIMVEAFGVTDPLVLATLLLHDVLEDTDTSPEDIRAAFGKYDGQGRILRALELLTHPDVEGMESQPQLVQELDYLRYVAGTLTAGDKILPNPECFEWLRTFVPLSKASDKIQNRRTLMGRKPRGRIEEICRNANTLVMFMEASGMTPAHKLKMLEEFSRTLLEIFHLFDLGRPENRERFLALLRAFLEDAIPANSGIRMPGDGAGKRFEEFARDNFTRFEETMRDPAKDVRVRLIRFERQILPAFLRELRLNPARTAAVMDAFYLFLFDVSEVAWLRNRQNILEFQRIIRRYKERIRSGEWQPELPGIIAELARYAHGDAHVAPPVVRFEGETAPAGVRRNGKKKRQFVAGLLPRLAMLPLKDIYWLEDDTVRSADRQSVEADIGGVDVSRRRDNRLVLRVHPQPIPNS